MILKLNINDAGNSLSDKFALVYGAPFELTLDNNYKINILWDAPSQWLKYSLFNENGDTILLNASLQLYPTNLSNDKTRALFVTKRYYLIDMPLSEWEALCGFKEYENADTEALLKKINIVNSLDFIET